MRSKCRDGQFGTNFFSGCEQKRATVRFIHEIISFSLHSKPQGNTELSKLGCKTVPKPLCVGWEKRRALRYERDLLSLHDGSNFAGKLNANGARARDGDAVRVPQNLMRILDR